MGPQSVRAVERAIDVLEVIKDHGGSAGVSEIARELGLAKSTVHRLLTALFTKQIVRRDDHTEDYMLGPKLLELAFSASEYWDVVSLSIPYLEGLRDSLGETAALALKANQFYTYVAQVVSLHEYKVTRILGRQYPLHMAAPGKAILAFSPDEELEEYLRDVPLTRATSRTITDPAVLREQLEQIRSQGYAISFGERVEDVAAIVAPIRNHRGCATAVISVVGPESRVCQVDLRATGEIVVEVAREIERACQVIGFEG